MIVVVHFGLGKAPLVERLEIRWSSGAVETLTNLAVNRRHVIVEGERRDAGHPAAAEEPR